MARPGGPRGHEVSKDFKGSMIRLIKNLSPWKVIMIFALTLAMVSALLALITPNKLSEFADTISVGLIPKTEVLQDIGVKISENMANTDIEKKLSTLFDDVELTSDEKLYVGTILNSLEDANEEESFVLVLSLPDKVLEYLFEDFKYEGVLISSKDQVKMIRLLISEKGITDLEELPKSIYGLVKPSIDMDEVKRLAIKKYIVFIC